MAADATIETVWIDNPPVNAITTEVSDGIRRRLEGLGPDVRVVVIRGDGDKAFSAGADLAAIAADGSPPGGIQPLADLIEALPVPVIAAIHGYCLGGGLEVALACDIRIARSDAKLALPEVGLGMIPGGGGTQRAPRLIGPGRAAWLMMSATRLSAAEAEAWGLVELVVDDLDEGIDRVTGTIAAQSPTALRELKQLLRATRESSDFRAELDAFARCVASEDGREGVAAFLGKRPPRWTGR
jgi:enoyl-CoA hydratase/carnithine racemase